MVKGQRQTLLRQLRARFGEVPEAITSRIASASSDTLDRWAERILTASTPDEVVREA